MGLVRSCCSMWMPMPALRLSGRTDPQDDKGKAGQSYLLAVVGRRHLGMLSKVRLVVTSCFEYYEFW